MSNEHHAIFAVSEVLGNALKTLDEGVEVLELNNIDQGFKITIARGMLKGIAEFLDDKKKEIEETQP